MYIHIAWHLSLRLSFSFSSSCTYTCACHSRCRTHAAERLNAEGFCQSAKLLGCAGVRLAKFLLSLAVFFSGDGKAFRIVALRPLCFFFSFLPQAPRLGARQETRAVDRSTSNALSLLFATGAGNARCLRHGVHVLASTGACVRVVWRAGARLHACELITCFPTCYASFGYRVCEPVTNW